MVMLARSIPEKHPIIPSLIAIMPLPAIKYLCPGSTLNAVLSSGAPRNVAGIKSKKICVMLSAMMNAHTLMGSAYLLKITI